LCVCSSLNLEFQLWAGQQQVLWDEAIDTCLFNTRVSILSVQDEEAGLALCLQTLIDNCTCAAAKVRLSLGECFITMGTWLGVRYRDVACL